MDKEIVRNQLESFMNYRKNYMKEKKTLILEFLTSNKEDTAKELHKIQETYYQEFYNFVDKLPDQLKVSKDFIDDELIMWFVFTLDEVINQNIEETLPAIIKKSEKNSD